ncbi:MAG: hypothetical protein IKE70_04255 [Bacilli bacterium]|nr:hypothetical protein [Bacilli bacterium]
MKELLEKLEELKQELDKSSTVIEIKELNKKLEQEEDLVEMVKKYQITKEESLRKEIIKNPIFLEYKKKENDLNFIILEINKRLKSMKKEGRVCR